MVKQIRPRRAALAILVCVSWTSAHSIAAAQPSSPAPLSDRARAYLESVLSVVQANSINRGRIDWPTVRGDLFSRAAGATVEADTHAAIHWLVSQLGDGHSAFLDPDALKSLMARSAAASGTAQGRIIDGRFGYISVPTFGSPDQATIDRFATDVQREISAVDAAKPCGWIVDLRSNGGGNMWPMLAGVGPIVGPGRLGSFRDPSGVGAVWSYENGEARSDSRALAKTLEAPVMLHVVDPPVAVLLGPVTASSGEAVAVAFRARASTRFFGRKTRGLTTSNRVFPLPDGALLNLTTATYADRSGTPYVDGLAPDEAWESSGDLTAQSAPVAWLAAQAACAHK